MSTYDRPALLADPVRSVVDQTDDEIVIESGFNEDADHYPTWPWYYDRTDEWLLRTSPSETVSLSMNDSVAITKSCAPTAALSVLGPFMSGSR